MRRDVLALFVRKELRDIRANRQVWPGYIILPVIAIVLPAVFLALVPLDLSVAAQDEDMRWLLRAATGDPGLAGYPEVQRLGRLVVRDFTVFYLLLPIILSSTSAALSFVLEKQQRTLEPILATPVTDQELVLAKLTAAVLPAWLFTVITAAAAALVLGIISAVRYGSPFLPGPSLLVLVGLVAPAVGVAGSLLAMRVSARMKDVQAALQVSGMVVVPAGIILAAIAGRPAAGNALIGLVTATLVALIDWWLYRGNLRRFSRERLLTVW